MRHLIVPPIRAGADLNAVGQLVRPAEIIRAQLGLVVGGEVVEADYKECIVYSLETLAISRMRSEPFAEAVPDFAILGREHANRGAGNVVLLDFICISTDGFEIEEDLPLSQDRSVPRVKHVKIVYVPISQVSTEEEEEDSTHRTGRDG